MYLFLFMKQPEMIDLIDLSLVAEIHLRNFGLIAFADVYKNSKITLRI